MKLRARVGTIVLAAFLTIGGVVYVLQKQNKERGIVPRPNKSVQTVMPNDTTEIDKLSEQYASLLESNGVTDESSDINIFFGVDTLTPLIKDAMLYIRYGEGEIQYHPVEANLEAISRKDVYDVLVNAIEFENRDSGYRKVIISPLYAGTDSEIKAMEVDQFMGKLYSNGGFSDEELQSELSNLRFNDSITTDQLLKDFIITCNTAEIQFGNESLVKQ